MAQPKKPPLSIRPGAERLSLIQAWATDHGLSQHAAILALIDLGLDSRVGATPAAARIREHINEARENVQAGVRPAGPRFSLSVGPPEAKPGSRLKKR